MVSLTECRLDIAFLASHFVSTLSEYERSELVFDGDVLGPSVDIDWRFRYHTLGGSDNEAEVQLFKSAVRRLVGGL